MKILIKYGNGSEELVNTDHTNEEAYVNEKFGSAYQAFLDGGGSISGVVAGAEESTETVVDAEAQAEALKNASKPDQT